MALDFKLFFIYHISMMVLMVAGNDLPINTFLTLVGALFAIIVTVSIVHRWKSKWHWPGVGFKGVLISVLGLGLGLFFLGSTVPRFSRLDPHHLPWLGGGGGIVVFALLVGFRISSPTEADFQRHCGDSPQDDPNVRKAPTEPLWNRRIRMAFQIYGTIIWILAVGFFWKSTEIHRDAVYEPTADRVEEITSHNRKTIYVTAEERTTYTILSYGLFPGIPSVFAIAAVLHFVLKIPIFPSLRPSSASEDSPGSPPASP